MPNALGSTSSEVLRGFQSATDVFLEPFRRVRQAFHASINSLAVITASPTPVVVCFCIFIELRSSCSWFNHSHRAELLRLFSKRTIESGKTYTSSAGCQMQGIPKIKLIFIP